ncbi:MAG: hypothetical protein ACI9XU_000130 [Arenicella sp.]|jgi:hypothetical protein
MYKPKYYFSIGLLTFISMLAGNVSAASLAELQKSAGLEKGFVGLIHDQASGKTYLKIDNLGEEFIYQSSLPSGLGSNDIGLDRGQQGDTRLVVFERFSNKVLLTQKPTDFRAITDNPLESAAIDEAFASSVLWGFEIEDSGGGWVLVDASEFLLQDIHGVGRQLEQEKHGTAYKVDASRSVIDLTRTKAFPDNTELQATITLVGTKPGDFVKQTVPNPYAITLKMHHSFVRLPDSDYTVRKFVPKSGYWSVEYQDYAQPINQKINQQFIGRHRLQKKDPSAESSEALEPIIYYLDPGVPEPIKSALLDGAGWWNSAFEEIGFKDAFQVKMLPADADPMDVRYNVIQWVHRSTRGWSYGQGVADPRTGEIIKGHVTLGSLRVRQDYLIAQGMLAPFADSEDDQVLMDLALARIRQLAAHEVGHTIGLLHNFAASNYGRESVMDYPHPQFELDGERVVAPNAYGVGLGQWDKAAIAYGYAEFTSADGQPLTPDQEFSELRRLIHQNDSNGLLFIADEDARSPGSAHANASLWDNGRDAVSELRSMMRIREVALSKFGADNLKAGRNWSDLEEILVPVYYSNRFQIQAVSKWLGGLTYDYGVKGGYGLNGDAAKQSQVSSVKPNLQVLDAASQNKALDILLEALSENYLSLSPELLSMMVPKAVGNHRSRESVNGDTGVTFDQLHLASGLAQHTLGLMLNPQRLARVQQQSADNDKIPSITDIGLHIHDAIFSRKVKPGVAALVHKSVMDLTISNYMNLIHAKDVSQSVKTDVLSALLYEKRYLEGRLAKANASDSYLAFYGYQLSRLQGFDVGLKDKLIELPKMPPGSPI